SPPSAVSWAALSVQVCVPLLNVPALSVASLGTPLMLTDSTSSPSTGASVSPSALPWLPSLTVTDADASPSTGFSASGLTVTAISLGADDALSPVVVLVAVPCSVPDVSPALSLSPTSCGAVSVQLPPPLLVPADSVASLGTPVMLIDRTSSPSTGVAVIVSAIAVTSLPPALSPVPARLCASGLVSISPLLTGTTMTFVVQP